MFVQLEALESESSGPRIYKLSLNQLIAVYRYRSFNPLMGREMLSSSWATRGFILKHAKSSPLESTKKLVRLSDLDLNGVCLKGF